MEIQQLADVGRLLNMAGEELHTFIRTYIQRFERYAENEGWEAGCYGTYLGTLLSGKAMEVYSRLPASEARESLLIHYPLTQEDYRKKFHSGTQTSMESASQFLARLEHFFG